MSDLKSWEEKIKEKRKNTDFREYLKEIVSWSTFVLYKNKGLISKFPETNRVKNIISYKEFEKTRESLLEGGKTYNFEENFFKNYYNLLSSINLFNFISYGGSENSDFADMILYSKNCYLSSTVINGCENILYSFSVKDSCLDVINSVSVYQNSQIVYFSCGVIESFKIFYSNFINNSSNLWFCSNLTGCSECIFCYDLENCSYCIDNKGYSEEEYFTKKKEILKNKKDFLKYYFKINKNGKNSNSKNVLGSGFVNSENVENGYYGYNVKNGRNLIFVGGVNGNEDMYDTFTAGANTSNNLYGIMGANGEKLFSCINITESSNLYYCYFLTNCSFCLGCIGLKNKSFCILNKQYTKEEWLEIADKIFFQMDKDGILGDFFPGSLNPFYFNDTMAYLIDESFTKEEVEKEGYLWRNENIKVDIPENAEIIYSKTPPARSSLPPQVRGIEGELSDFQNFDSNGNWQINPEILKKVIQDENGNIYKIVKMEYDFLVKYGLPLPEIHWLDRIKLGFKF